MHANGIVEILESYVVTSKHQYLIMHHVHVVVYRYGIASTTKSAHAVLCP